MSSQSITIQGLNDALQSDNPPTIFDVRKKPAFDAYPDTVANATWQAFDQVETWGASLSDEVKANAIVVYCVHGHEVSQNAAQALNDLGFSATYLEGGWVAWNDAGFDMSSGDHT